MNSSVPPHHSVIAPLSTKSTSISSSSEKNSSAQTKNIATESLQALQQKFAPILDVAPKEIKNQKLYSLINQWLGVPYCYAGKTENGVDCSDFSAILLKNIYGKNIVGSSASIFESCNPISQDNLKEGDLVFFKINSKNISHMGVYLMNDKFVHAATHSGVTISDLNADYYKKYFFSGGRL